MTDLQFKLAEAEQINIILNVLPDTFVPSEIRYVRTGTPWGQAQTAASYGRGITMYSTAGHGGFKVSAGLLNQMFEPFITADAYADGNKGWFEEDCAWALVVVSFPERFNRKSREQAIQTVQSYFPAQWAAYVADKQR